MDISALKLVSASKSGAEMKLVDPFQGNDTGARFQVIGFDAPEIVEASRAWDREAASDTEADPIEAINDRRTHICIAAVSGWSDFNFGGELPYTPEKAKEILTDPEFAWIRDQVWEFGRQRRNFMPRPEADASSGPNTSAS